MPTPPEHPEPPGSERGRDEKRDEDTPRYHGGSWHRADHEAPPGAEIVRDRPGREEGRPEHGGDRDGTLRPAKPHDR